MNRKLDKVVRKTTEYLIRKKKSIYWNYVFYKVIVVPYMNIIYKNFNVIGSAKYHLKLH